MIEVEIKAPAPDLRVVEERLRRIGAKLVDDHLEKDLYFSSPLKDMVASDEALRVREMPDRSFLTYKGPKIDVTTKSREEVEVEVSSADGVITLLRRLGFTPTARIEKSRRIYETQEFFIMLDDVFSLGTFVEIESRRSDLDARERAFQLLDELGLDKTERRSYLELLMDRGGDAD